MSDMANTAPQYAPPVITLPEEDRVDFMVKVYQHLGVALAAFMAIEVLFFATGIAEGLYDFFFASGGRWLLMLGLVMIGSWFSTQATHDLTNPGRQYAGLFGTAAIEALIFAPFLYYVFNVQENSGDVWAAAAITGIGFAGLTAVAWTTRRDLSFMRPLIMWGGVAAMVLIVAALLFGFHIGTWFSVAMIALAGGSILYSTQRILRTYPAGAHVAGAVNLFGSLMLMFWYVLRLLTDR